MKRIIVIILFSISLPATIVAQVRTGRNQLNASYGWVTTPQIFDAVLGVVVSVGSLGELSYNATDYTGGIFITYHRSSENNRFHYGVTAGFDRISGRFENLSGSKKGDFEDTNLTFAAEGAISYMNKPSVRLYGLLGAGYTAVTYKNTVKVGGSEIETVRGGYFNGQLTPIGAAFGKNFGGYIELGVGYKGLVNLGLFARL